MKLRVALSSALLAATASFAAFPSGIALAEEVRMPVGSESYAGALPNRGQTKASVEAEFGSPNSAHGPSGEPPIYFWEYPDFTVYFEGEHVIHTVIKKRN